MHIFAYMKNTINKYKALGEATRIRIIKLLESEKDGIYVCELVDILNKPQYSISKNLKILQRSDLIFEVRSGKMIKYHFKNESEANQLLIKSISLSNSEEVKTVFERDLIEKEKRLKKRSTIGCTIQIEK